MAKKLATTVVVITEMKEIFCGQTEDFSGEIVSLKNARQAIYFSADTHGLLGLALNGPAAGSRIVGPVKHVQCRKIHTILICTDEATAVWENAKWEK